MDPKELRANAPLSISVSDDGTKYAHSGPTLSANKSKSYHEIGSTSMGKVDATPVRPCAIIGPDRVLPQNSGDVYLKKTPAESWPCTENTYRQPPDYPNRLSDYSPIRNISPRQTFQENMQRIMVPPTYSSIKNSDDNLKNTKLNMPQEAKYCDVPYNMNPVTNELKSVRNSEIPIPSVNPAFNRGVPHYGWAAGVNIRPPRPYGAPEIYQYPEYPSCVGPRPVTITHPHRVHRDEAAQVYSERLYQEANIRFKPYPTLKEKHQQTRYDYISNYQNTFHPPITFPPHKYDLQKSLQTHPYSMYPQVPLKYLDRRLHETFVDGYPRSNQQPNFNPQFPNQVIHPPYGPISGNCVQNKSFTDLSAKPISTNKLPYETNNKIYQELDTSRNKGYSIPENAYYNDINHAQHLRGDILLPNRSTINMHSMPPHQVYRRDTLPLKNYEYYPHYRTIDPSLNFNLPRLPLQYSPNTIAISPSDSNTSNDTIHTIGTSQEDCGYVSQSSTNSVRSLDGVSVPKDMYRRQDFNIHATPRNLNGSDKITKNKTNSSSKKNINVRQFLQMWNEGEDEANDSNREIVTQIHPSNYSIPSKTVENQEQLYVLGLVNVPNEELSKYEHIQKISKLPENIKGYNSIELLNQYEELLESPNNNYKVIPKVLKDHNSIPKRSNEKENNVLPRPVSPLDVEAKISQSVIHKEVGCNFEIKPCSPEMLNAEVAMPIHSILGERIIEKVANPMISKSPILSIKDDNKAHNSDISNMKIASCDMINKQCTVNNYANITKNNNYNVQDFESNSGISLASLPRLDNDIELNFPEINQQFIKANKIESDVQSFQKNLSQLNLDQITHEKNNINSSLSPQFCLGSAPEKEFSKLSKYRKNKKCDTTPKEDTLEKDTVTVQQRINSVIIKNPDTKLPGEIDVSLSIPNKVSCENIDNTYNTKHDPENFISSINPKKGEDKNMSFDIAIDFSLNKTEIVTSYDYLNKCTDVPHFFGDNHNVSFSSENVIDKEVISKEQPMELHTKQFKAHEIFQENVINNKEPKEYSNIEENENRASDTHKIPVDELNLENNIPVIKNLSIITEIEEFANTKKNNTCIVSQEEISLLETSGILKPVNTENSKNNDTASGTSSETKPNCSLEKKLESTQDEFEITPEKVNFRDNINNQGVDKYDDDKNNESNNNSEISNTFHEVKEFSNVKELLIVKEKDNSLNTEQKTENSTAETTLSDVIENKIDDKTIITSTGSNQELELSEISNEIENDEEGSKEENIIKLSVNLGTIDSENIEKENVQQFHYTKLPPSDDLTNNQVEAINKTNENDSQFSNIDAPHNYTFKVCHQKLGKVDVELPISEIYECDSDKCKTFNSAALESSTIDHSERSQDENFDSQNIITAKNNVESQESNYNFSTTKENENITNKFNPEFNLRKSTDVSTSKEKYMNIGKELYSPWIQKLLIFREGVCANIQSNVREEIEEKVIKGNVLLRNTDEILCEDLKKQNIDTVMCNVQNNLMNSDNPKNEIQSCCDINSQENGEYCQNLLARDLSGMPENDGEDHVEENHSITPTTDCVSLIPRNVLKRSLSESALEDYRDDENIDLIGPSKRKKRNPNNIISHPIISEDLCSIIQTHRRNSISTFYNEDNVFILIDNDLIITEENDDSDKMYYTEVSHDFANNIPQNDCTVGDTTTLPIINDITSVESTFICEQKPVEESWVEDVACIETVVSDDINDDIDYEIMSPKKCNLDDETVSDQSVIFCDNKHIDKIKNTYGNNMCSNDTQILQTLYMTPQMNVNKTLLDIESRSVKNQEHDETLGPPCENNDFPDKCEGDIISCNSCEVINDKENINTTDTKLAKTCQTEETSSDIYAYVTSEYIQEKEKCTVDSITYESTKDCVIQSSKNSTCNYLNSSSPEVSSTTPEEKNSTILLKITNHKGSRISKINEIGSLDRLSYKLTEKKDYHNYNANFSSSRTLITKAAQKYIPPLKETIRDLKIKLALPQPRLHTLKQLKVSKGEPKIDDNVIKYSHKKSKQEIPKKPKPKFEDVLKSIDEIQFKKHKDKIKKGKNGIPKVVIKKNENGAHFASCRTMNEKETYNPDLTGRKWQPWVFLEKNNFIDKMAIKNKVKAVYCHRKKSYVLAEKFRKYKSIFNANFVISQPSLDNSCKGTLKYTIKLKHK